MQLRQLDGSWATARRPMRRSVQVSEKLTTTAPVLSELRRFQLALSDEPGGSIRILSGSRRIRPQGARQRVVEVQNGVRGLSKYLCVQTLTLCITGRVASCFKTLSEPFCNARCGTEDALPLTKSAGKPHRESKWT